MPGKELSEVLEVLVDLLVDCEFDVGALPEGCAERDVRPALRVEVFAKLDTPAARLNQEHRRAAPAGVDVLIFAVEVLAHEVLNVILGELYRLFG